MFCFPTGVFTAAFDCGIEWLIVKGIADYAGGSQLTSESWSSCASVMAASLVAHILNDPCIFHSWPHYQLEGNHSHKGHKNYDLLNPLMGYLIQSQIATWYKLYALWVHTCIIPNSGVQYTPLVQIV